MPEFRPDTLYYGDNLEVLRGFPSECADLVYLDPPFNSNRSYNVLFREAKGAESEAQIEAFEDTWHWGLHAEEAYDDVARRGDDVARLLAAFVSALGRNDVTAYLTMMAPRLLELQRVMKPTASIYLHCDPTASHYLRVLMDAVFGAVNFKNEIVWRRTGSHNAAKRFGPIHDTILFYTSGPTNTFVRPFTPYLNGHVEDYFKKSDERGQYWTNALTGAGQRRGDSGKPWRGFDPSLKGRHWAVPGRISEELGLAADMPLLDRLEALYQSGFILLPSESSVALPTYKQYLKDSPGQAAQDIWAYQPHTQGVLYESTDGIDEDVRWLSPYDKERLGYPTQKPEGLLERIISASSSEGDVVLDPFCGCGTAVVAAHRLGRRWVGIDITWLAVDLMRRRLRDTFPGDFEDGILVDGEPADEGAAFALAERDKFQFQYWAVGKLGGVARGGRNRKGPDRGIDGVLSFPDRNPNDPEGATEYRSVIISVKGGGTGPNDVRDLRGTVEREKAPIGVLVVVRAPTREMLREAAAAGAYTSPWTGVSYPVLQILTAADVVHGKEIDMPPQRGVSEYAKASARPAREQGRLGL